MTHRPLSAWIAKAEPSAFGTVRWVSPAAINYGDERADARSLPEFDDGWQRRAVALDGGYLSLGLVRDTSGETVIELDNHARPVRVSAPAAALINRIEDSWPESPLTDADLVILAGEDKAVRYMLADRLADEGDPPPELFHILPWDLVDRLAGQVADILDGATPAPVITELGHWFTPVGSRFTAALEQLDEGLRDHDPLLARVAATALYSRLLEVKPGRLPQSTRLALARLAETLGQANPFLAFMTRRVIAWLSPGDEMVEDRAPRLSSDLPAAADTDTGVRTESLDAAREPFTVQLIVTATGRAEVAVSAPLSDDLQSQVSSSYGVMLLPVRVAGAASSTRYLIALRYADSRLSGRLDLPVPAGPFVEADIDGPPIGVTEAAFLSATDVRRSISGVPTNAGRAMWAQLATQLPQAHPLRAVIAGETE
jgi:hypothetical protein